MTTDPKTGQPSIRETFKQTFASDDPCANNARNIGIVTGALIGGLVGNKVGGNNKALGTLIGLGIGGALGGLIGSEVDKRECELAKIQKKYDLDMQVTPIEVQTTSSGGSSAAGPQKVGLSVSVVDVDNKPQFRSGSSTLEVDANTHFAEIAHQYSIKSQLESLGAGTSQQERDKVAQALKNKRVLLIGHTDDSGNTALNADLSEQRARSVAQVFKANGVAEDQLYYQGAGETLPIADNRTEQGRAKNRRVEIVDLSNEEVFKLYLQTRRANTAYYRPVEAKSATTTKETALSKPVAAAVTPASTGTIAKPATNSASKPKPAVSDDKKPKTKALPSTILAVNAIDFGGVPFSTKQASLDVGEVKAVKKPLRLITEAEASDMTAISSCNLDRPRNTGAVKSFKDDHAYATSDFMPGLYGRTWHDTVGGHLVVLNKVAVLSDGAAPANAPELKIYASYDAVKNRNAKPDIELAPAVNIYQGSNGLLYRLFAEGKGGLECLDILLPKENNGIAKGGKILYNRAGAEYVVDFKPRINTSQK
ncbi:OmpA family protein [Methylobacillus gramineus]|uniref:OmpA family protein n=1 Tax=Methylobacillus gramineus TaxID=755169 RepID=UPI001D000694|nr:OmpA family protein [Methylobacillus gramineus]MCB5183741.1 OmpA family protein [Methylobacillus gramineus]